jgi:hypothetical protein
MAPINIYSPSDEDKAQAVHEIIRATGRNIQFIATSGLVACPVCAGTDPFCSTCNGNPTVDLEYTHERIASVRWRPSERRTYRPQAQSVEGDCQVVVIFDGDVEPIIRQTRYVIVDDRKCVIDSWYRKGAPPNRLHILLKEDVDLGGHRVG